MNWISQLLVSVGRFKEWRAEMWSVIVLWFLFCLLVWMLCVSVNFVCYVQLCSLIVSCRGVRTHHGTIIQDSQTWRFTLWSWKTDHNIKLIKLRLRMNARGRWPRRSRTCMVCFGKTTATWLWGKTKTFLPNVTHMWPSMTTSWEPAMVEVWKSSHSQRHEIRFSCRGRRKHSRCVRSGTDF